MGTVWGHSNYRLLVNRGACSANAASSVPSSVRLQGCESSSPHIVRLVLSNSSLHPSGTVESFRSFRASLLGLCVCLSYEDSGTESLCLGTAPVPMASALCVVGDTRHKTQCQSGVTRLCRSDQLLLLSDGSCTVFVPPHVGDLNIELLYDVQ